MRAAHVLRGSLAPINCARTLFTKDLRRHFKAATRGSLERAWEPHRQSYSFESDFNSPVARSVAAAMAASQAGSLGWNGNVMPRELLTTAPSPSPRKAAATSRADPP